MNGNHTTEHDDLRDIFGEPKSAPVPSPEQLALDARAHALWLRSEERLRNARWRTVYVSSETGNTVELYRGDHLDEAEDALRSFTAHTGTLHYDRAGVEEQVKVGDRQIWTGHGTWAVNR